MENRDRFIDRYGVDEYIRDYLATENSLDNPNYNPNYLGFMDTEFDNVESDEERDEQNINDEICVFLMIYEN